MRSFKSIILLVPLILMSTILLSQTSIINVPIVTEKDDGIVIDILVYDEVKKDSSWININQTYLEYDLGWYATGKINIKVYRDEVYYFRFMRGSKKLDCFDYTYLTIYGDRKKKKIKSTSENNITFEVDGIHKVFGTPPETDPVDLTRY